MLLAKKFGGLLYHARRERGLTQAEVAEAADISERWYQKIESGAKLPGIITFLRLIRFLNIDINPLVK